MSFANQISKDRGQPATVRIGIVTGINPLLVTVQDTQMRDVGMIKDYTPALGDVVALLGQSAVSADGSSWLALGSIVSSSFSSAWTPYTPIWTSTGVQPALNNGTRSGAYYRDGSLVVYKGRFDFGSTTTFGTGIWNFSIPVPFAGSSAVGTAYLSDATGQAYPAVTAFFGSILFLVANAGNVTNAVPFAWAVNDNLAWTVTYEAA